MKTVQMTIDDSLLARVDEVTEALHTSRSAFIRDALRLALGRYEIARMEQQHAEGYAQHPAETGEFDIGETEQAWGEP